MFCFFRNRTERLEDSCFADHGFIGIYQPCLIHQAAELRAYLKSKGAEISEENSEGGLHVDLAQIIEACDVCLKEDDKGLFLIFCNISY